MSDLKKIKICFLGTPDFAANHLRTLFEDPLFEVVGVVTQPDRPAGRKMQLTPSAVKVMALNYKSKVLTPENLRKDPEALELIQSWNADVAVVVAYGQILSQTFLDSFQFGAVNVHGSLLPLYRGAAPIQRSLQNGDQITGVSLQKMVFKLDAGPVISERRIHLDSEIDAVQLYGKLCDLGCEMLKTDFIRYIRGEMNPKVQDESQVTTAAKISKDESLLNFNMPAENFHNRVRAFTMGPGTHVIFQGQRLKIHKTKVIYAQGRAGEISSISIDEVVIGCQKNLISLLEVQLESKPKMKIHDFIKKLNLKNGDMFQ